jgi:hypothetical protein
MTGNKSNQLIRNATSLLFLFAFICFGFAAIAVVAQENKTDTPKQGPATVPTADFIKLLDVKLPNGKTQPGTNRQLAWMLGTEMGLVLHAKLRKSPPAEVKASLEKANLLATTLGVELPQMPKVDGFGDAYGFYEFLVNRDDDKSIQSLVAAKHGDSCGNLFSMSAHTLTTNIFYAPANDEEGDENFQKNLNNLVCEQFAVALLGSDFKASGPVFPHAKKFVQFIQSNKPIGDDYKSIVQKTRKAVSDQLFKEYLAMTAPENRPKAPRVDPALVKDPKTPMDLAAETLLKQFLQPNADLRKLTLSLKPTENACRKFLKEPMAAKALRVYESLFADPSMVLAPNSGQTEIMLRKATSKSLRDGNQEFPGGYKQFGQHLRDGFVIYELKFVRPGARLGMRFDGLVQIDGKWYLFPKVWRLLPNAPGAFPDSADPKNEPEEQQ